MMLVRTAGHCGGMNNLTLLNKPTLESWKYKIFIKLFVLF